MRRFGFLKYLSVFTLPALAYFSFTHHGWFTLLPVAEAFVLIPMVELAFKPNPKNHSEEEELKLLTNKWFDVVVYLVVPVQFLCLWYFLISMQESDLSLLTIIGRVSAMGLLCGVMGINVAHELGHRKKKSERFLAKMLLMTSLYMHFYVEHNRGHHKNVSTKDDPSSARFGETLYGFWFRSVFTTYISAWHLEFVRLKKRGIGKLSLHNEMLQFQVIQLAFVFLIYWLFGWPVVGYFIVAAVMGFILLETVNYIEHYGLQREKKGDLYERVMPAHSWNSDHVIGRLVLFELSRHSDHHYKASRKYQILRHMEESPQMPTGYPGMMLMATIPPLWFKIMNDRIANFKKSLV
ncbi:MAG: alkane 1-monooxygenase [Flammeovirgaceae bacterium]|nr:alkane 1-monooxygenase [Flammeovirgaceae bacterium]MBE62432.1 alkane 1-monooxygenase [Flammeovirgaceae bacterium]|tara:strand:+ start:1748 stop:2800 length:1053 start_codon:yes stop_codon:yes gene_type:complete